MIFKNKLIHKNLSNEITGLFIVTEDDFHK